MVETVARSGKPLLAWSLEVCGVWALFNLNWDNLAYLEAEKTHEGTQAYLILV